MFLFLFLQEPFSDHKVRERRRKREGEQGKRENEEGRREGGKRVTQIFTGSCETIFVSAQFPPLTLKSWLFLQRNGVAES